MFRDIARSIRTNIVVGLALVTPIVITGIIVYWLFTRVTSLVVVFLPRSLMDDYPLLLRTFALLLVVVLLFLVGLLIRNIMGKRLYQLGDMMLGRIPVINKLYISFRQIIEAVLDQSQTLFKEVVLLEYPRKGMFAIGFVTTQVPETLTSKVHGPESMKDLVAVFVPTTPNPTSGVLIFAPRSEVYPVPLTIGDAMKLIVSGGAVYPGVGPLDDRPTLLDKLETWIAREARNQGQGTNKGASTLSSGTNDVDKRR